MCSANEAQGGEGMKLTIERVSYPPQKVKTMRAHETALEESSTLGTDHSEMKIATNCPQSRMVTHPLPTWFFENMACTAAFVNSQQSWLFGRKNATAFFSERQISETAMA